MINNEELLQDNISDNTKNNFQIPSIRYRVIRSDKEFDELEASWNLLCESTKSHVFQTFEWNRTWWKHFGSYGKLQIFVLYDNDSIVGIAPLFIDEYTLFGLKTYTILRMIGSGIRKTEDGVLLGTKAYSDYLQFLIQDEYETSFFQHLFYFLMHEVHFDTLLLEEIPEKSSTLAITNNAFSSFSYETNLINASIAHSVIPEDAWEAYLKKLTAKERNNVRRSLKRIRKGGKKMFRIEHLKLNDNFKATLNRFVELHQKQWNKRALPGTFGETCMHHFFLEIAEILNEKNQLLIYAALPEGTHGIEHYLAIDIIMVYSNRMYSQHRALDTSSPFYSKAPGKVLLTVMIQQAIQSQLIFDFLRGEEDYKQRLATSVNQNKTIEISSSSKFRKWYGRVVMTVHHIKKTYAIERARKQLILKNTRLISGWVRYLKFMLARLRKRFSTGLILLLSI